MYFCHHWLLPLSSSCFQILVPPMSQYPLVSYVAIIQEIRTWYLWQICFGLTTNGLGLNTLLTAYNSHNKLNFEVNKNKKKNIVQIILLYSSFWWQHPSHALHDNKTYSTLSVFWPWHLYTMIVQHILLHSIFWMSLACKPNSWWRSLIQTRYATKPDFKQKMNYDVIWIWERRIFYTPYRTNDNEKCVIPQVVGIDVQ